MRTAPSTSPGMRTHSCSLVYFRSSGYTSSPSIQVGTPQALTTVSADSDRLSRLIAELLDVVTELLPGADPAAVQRYVDELGS